MFRPFRNWPSSGWIQCQRNCIPTVTTVISDSVSTGKRGGRDLAHKKQGVCVNDIAPPPFSVLKLSLITVVKVGI